jgi:hypothetical protein
MRGTTKCTVRPCAVSISSGPDTRADTLPECQREGVRERLAALGLGPLYLPTLTNVKPDVPHIPILAPAAEVLKTRKRIVVVINDDHYQDLGILAYRLLQREGGLNGGSIINFAKKLISRNNPDADLEEKLSTDRAGVQDNEQIPGLIVMNTASLLYSHKFNKALVMRSWNSLPRQSIFHDPIMVHEENRVDGHRTQQEHVKSVFDSVIKNPEFVAPDAEVYVVAIENGSSNIVDILNEDCKCCNQIGLGGLVILTFYQSGNLAIVSLPWLSSTRVWMFLRFMNRP